MALGAIVACFWRSCCRLHCQGQLEHKSSIECIQSRQHEPIKPTTGARKGNKSSTGGLAAALHASGACFRRSCRWLRWKGQPEHKTSKGYIQNRQHEPIKPRTGACKGDKSSTQCQLGGFLAAALHATAACFRRSSCWLHWQGQQEHKTSNTCI